MDTIPSERLHLAVVTGSTRPQRRGDLVTEWVATSARTYLADRAGIEIVTIDALPMLDEPMPAAIGSYVHEHTKQWANTIQAFDAFIFVTPEYNHSMPAPLKNAIDYLFAEWNDKAAGFVSYGLNGGVRAVEHLRLTLAEVKVACVRSQVALGLFTDFDIPDMTQPGTLTPADHHLPVLQRMLDELTQWGAALRTLRNTHP